MLVNIIVAEMLRLHEPFKIRDENKRLPGVVS